MKWLRAIWKAIIVLLASLKSDNTKAQQESQHIQDEIVQETQHEIEEIQNKTDDQLTDIAESIGLVQPQDTDRSGKFEFGVGPKDFCTRSKPSSETKE